MKFGAAIPVANDTRYLPAVVGQLLKVCDRVVLLRGCKSFSGLDLVLRPLPKLDPRVEIVEGEWTSESETRNAGMEMLKDCDYVFTVDSDEIFSDKALAVLKEKCSVDRPRALLGGMHTYWKTIEFRIDPPEKLVAPILIRNDVRFERLRMFSGQYTVVPMYVFHHLSWVRTDAEAQEKLRLFGHASEVVPAWYQRVWKEWDDDHTLEDLHPTHPSAYKRAVAVTDDSLKKILAEYGALP